METVTQATPAGTKEPHVRLAHLYAGRHDIQGTESGGFYERRVVYGHYAGHLQGQLGLAIFPLLRDGTCAFALSDVDVHDLDRVLQLQRLLKDHGIPAIVLTSRQKGYHVTIFLTEPMPAAPIREVFRRLLI